MPAQRLRSLVLVLLALSGCGKGKAPAPAPVAAAPTVVSKALKVGLSGVPAGLKAVADAGEIRLTGADGGVITVARGTGTDLEAAVREEEARVRALPGRRFLGSVELLCQFGQARLTRDQSGTDEEIRIFLVVPAARSIVLTSAYPARSVGPRKLDQMLLVLQNLQTVP